MPRRIQRAPILTLLLGVILFAAQFHICTDLALDAYNPPACQLCSTASSVVVPASPAIAIMPVANRIEVLRVVVTPSPDVPRVSAPRAPPIF